MNTKPPALDVRALRCAIGHEPMADSVREIQGMAAEVSIRMSGSSMIRASRSTYDGTLEHRSPRDGRSHREDRSGMRPTLRAGPRRSALHLLGRQDRRLLDRRWTPRSGGSSAIDYDSWTERPEAIGTSFTSDDRLSVGSEDGCIYVLDARSGRIEGRLQLYHQPGPLAGGPRVVRSSWTASDSSRRTSRASSIAAGDIRFEAYSESSRCA